MLSFRSLAPLAALFAAMLAAPAVGVAQSAVATRTLDNGMRVFVKTDRRAPVVVNMVWYTVGSIDEMNGVTGIAHVLEHMMFKGTRDVPGGEFSKRIAAAGGRENAFTSNDYTGYFQSLHKSQLPLAIRLEADRMANLVLSGEEFEKEIKVVMEERRWRTEDRPRAVVYERLMATMLQAHPYRNPVVGWMNDLENMTVDDVKAFYERWYAPNNATLVVVGDVSPDEVFKLAQQHFGPIPRRALPQRKPQDEPPQFGLKRLTVKVPAEQPYVLMAYRVPVLRDIDKDWEPYALEVLANVLDGHDAARLNRRLVREERIAVSADASYDSTARGPGAFFLSGVPVEGRSAQDIEAALKREVARIVDEGVTEQELDRVKAQAVAAQVYARDSMMFQARQIGSLEAIGLPHRLVDLYVDKLRAVTPAQVQAVAKQYLIDDALTIAHLDPQPLDRTRPARPPAGLRHAQ